MSMDKKLYIAAKKGDMKVVESCKHQFSTQLTPYNNTVLHVASQHDGFINEKNKTP